MRRSNFICVMLSMLAALCFSNVAVAMGDPLSHTSMLTAIAIDSNPHAGAAVDSSDESGNALVLIVLDHSSPDILVQTSRWGSGLSNGSTVFVSRCGCRSVKPITGSSTGPPENRYSYS